jgi:hypothetical protein
VKAKITAGGEVDFLTKDELHHELGQFRSWMQEAMRGPHPIRFDAFGTIAAGAVVVDGQNGSGRLGPEPGMVWLVTRVVVSGLTLATDPTSLYVNNTDPRHLVFPTLSGVAGSTGYHEFPAGQIVLTSNDRLILASTGAVAATGNVFLAGSAWELPAGMTWKLIG